MTSGEILNMVKANLSIASGTWNTYLSNLVEVSRKEIAREGINLNDDDFSDCNLIVMYTSYLWRKRAEDTAGMPRMLRYALNNRLMAQKGATS